MPDGKNLIFNRNGHIEKIAVTGGTPQIIDTGFARRCNNDHGISPDGTQLVISDNSQKEPSVARLYRANRRRRASAHHAEITFVLAWMVTGWENAGLCRRKEW